MTGIIQLLGVIPVLVLGMARMAAAFLAMPFLGQPFLSGITRNVFTVSICLVLFPPILAAVRPPELSPLLFFAILAKELFLGIILGLTISIPYFVAESTGFFIDNQKGATLAAVFNPFFQEETSPMGLFFVQLISVLFFTLGGLQTALTGLYESYTIFPVFQLLPTLQPSGVNFFADFIGLILRLVLTYAAPVTIIIFLSELGLGLINRFAPQFNVFSESLGVKAGVASFMLLLYSSFLVGYFKELIVHCGELTRSVFSFFQQ